MLDSSTPLSAPPSIPTRRSSDLERPFNNAGTVIANGGGQISCGAVPWNATNSGTFDIQSDVSLVGGGTFNNTGTLTKSGGTGVSIIQPGFNNSGTLSVKTGTLQC